MSDRLSSIELRRVSIAPIPVQEQLPALDPQAVAPRQWDRTFLSAEKLKPDQSIAHLFQRIQPSGAQALAYVNPQPGADRLSVDGLIEADNGAVPGPAGEKSASHENYGDMFDFSSDDRGKLIAKLKATDKGTKLEDSVEAVAYNSFRADIKDQKQIADQQKSGLRNFLNKVAGLFKKDTQLIFERTEVGPEPEVGAADDKKKIVARDVRMKISATGSEAAGEGHLIDNSAKADLKDHSLKWKILMGAIVVVGVVAAFTLLPAVLGVVVTGLGVVLTAAVGSGIGLVAVGIGGAVLGKTLSYVKAPWWGRTVQGQIEKMERKEAVKLGDSYAQMVRQQFVVDHKSEHGVGQREGGWNKSLLVNPDKLSDFMAIAAQNDPGQLKELIKKHLLDPETSHLDAKTIANAKGSALGAAKRWFFTGNAKGHAEKTVNQVADQIALGIMRGIGEGTMQLLIAELSDELTEAGGKAASAMFNPTQEAFAAAVGYLKPEVGGYQIGDTAILLDRINNYAETSTKAQGLLKIEFAKGDLCTFGLINAKSFDTELKDLDRVIGVHQASLAQVKMLVGVKALGFEGSNAAGTLGAVNEGIAGLFGEDLTKSGINVLASQLKNDMELLRGKIANPAVTDALIREHADALMDVMAEMDIAIDAAATYAITLCEAETAFKSEGLTQDVIQEHSAALKQYDKSGPNLNPLAADGVDSNFIEVNARRDKLVEGIASIEDAYGAAGRFKVRLDAGVAEVSNLDTFEKALSEAEVRFMQQAIDLQGNRINSWTNLGFKAPTDLKPDQAMSQWRSSIAGAALGLDADQQSLSTVVLAKLGDAGNKDLITKLGDVENPKLADLLVELQGKLGNVSAAQNALDSYQLASGALRPETAAQLTKALHASFSELINKHQVLMKVDKNLIKAFDGFVGGKLYEWHAGLSDNAGLRTDKPEALNPGEFLAIIHRFVTGLDDSEPANSTITALLNLTSALADADDIQTLARDAVKLAAVNTRDLEILGGLTRVLSDQQVSSLDAAITDQKVAAQAAMQALSQRILPGVDAGSNSQAVQRAVVDAASLKNPGDEIEFAVIIADLKAKLALRKNVVVNQTELAGQIAAAAAELKNIINFDGSTDKLVEKVIADPEMGRELLIVLHAHHLVAAIDSRAGLAHEFTSADLVAGAKKIGELAILTGDAIESKDLTTEIKKRLSARNDFINIFKKQGFEKPPALSKVQMDFVSDFLYEERAHQALMTLEGAPKELSSLEQRIMIEGTAVAQVNTENRHGMFLSQLLNDGSMKHLQQMLQTSFAGQAKAMKGLGDKLDTHINAANSDYLSAQVQALEDKIFQPAALMNAFKNAKTGNLAAVGRVFMDADKAKAMPPSELENVYLRGMYESSLNSLKWFDPKKFSAERPGFLGRMMFRLMGRGKRLPAMLGTKNLANISAAVVKIGTGSKPSEQLQAQVKLLNESIAALQDRKDSLINDPEKLRLAYSMLAVEQLEHKASGGVIDQLTEEDIKAIDGRWDELFAVSKNAKEYFQTTETPVKVRATLATITSSLGKKFTQEASNELQLIRQQQQDIGELHQRIKQGIDELPDAQGKLWHEGTYSESHYGAHGPDIAKSLQGLGLHSLDMALVGTMLELGSCTADVFANHLKLWENAHQEIENNPDNALLLGRQAKHELGVLIEEAYSKEIDATEFKAELRELRDTLEDNFLNAMTQPSPQTLQALDIEEMAGLYAGSLDDAMVVDEADSDLRSAVIVPLENKGTGREENQGPVGKKKETNVKSNNGKTGSPKVVAEKNGGFFSKISNVFTKK
jgi:hypothetical protein